MDWCRFYSGGGWCGGSMGRARSGGIWRSFRPTACRPMFGIGGHLSMVDCGRQRRKIVPPIPGCFSPPAANIKRQMNCRSGPKTLSETVSIAIDRGPSILTLLTCHTTSNSVRSLALSAYRGSRSLHPSLTNSSQEPWKLSGMVAAHRTCAAMAGAVIEAPSQKCAARATMMDVRIADYMSRWPNNRK